MKARIKIDPERVRGRIDNKIYGQFMCRRPGCSEGGLYDPEAPTADEYGIRRDVAGFMADLKPPILRWPGGCTGTSYHWLDGVGPVEQRPQKIDLHFGWPARYEFGTDEFIEFCRRIGTEPHLNLAMGTGTLDEAAAWLEYCNGTHDTYYANLRRKYGHEEPYRVKYWQLGNEMYGPWEIGYCKAEEYAREAREWAKVLRRVDPNISIIAVGGHATRAPVREWGAIVIPELLPYVDYIAFHTYWGANEWRDRPPKDPWRALMGGPYLAEEMIRGLTGVIRETRRLFSRRFGMAGRPMKVACTEWNVSPAGGMMAHHPIYHPFGPTYTLRDALPVAAFINIMQRRCQEITLATVAQSINVVGLIMVTEQGAWREPVYWPLWMQVHHSGPLSIDTWVDVEHFQSESLLDPVPYLDCSATLDPDAGKLYLSLVNLHPEESIDAQIRLQDARIGDQGEAIILYHDDPKAMNGPSDPDHVAPKTESLNGLGNDFTYSIPPHSYVILSLDLKP